MHRELFLPPRVYDTLVWCFHHTPFVSTLHVRTLEVFERFDTRYCTYCLVKIIVVPLQ